MVENPKEQSPETRMEGTGYCIGCGGYVILNASRPLCYTCYKKWEVNTGKFRISPQKYCHSCGKEWGTTINHPFCSPCQQKNRTRARQSRKTL
jgi:hypothetical protein